MSRITKVSFDKRTAGFRVYLNTPKGQRAVSSAAKHDVERRESRRVRDTIESHFRHALAEVGNVLENPGVGTVATGARTVKFNAKGGGPAAIRVRWKPLTPAYIRRKKVSSSFWRKGDQTKKPYTQLAELYAAAVSGTGSVKQTNTSSSIVPRNPNRIQVRTRVGLPRLKVPLNRLITSPFLRAKALPNPLVGGYTRGQNSVTRILFPEAQRPLVSLLAARMGRDMYSALRSK